MITIEIEGVEYYPATELMKELSISRQTLWRWRQDGKIPVGHLYRGTRIIFTVEEVEAIRQYANRVEPLNPADTNPDIIRNPPVKGVFRCTVPSLNLRPGRYYISISVFNSLGQRDKISRACIFDVVKSDVYGTARLPKEGIIFLDSEWDIEGQ